MRPADVTLGMAYVLGVLAFVAAMVHVAFTGPPRPMDIAVIVGACFVAFATATMAVRRRPHQTSSTTPANAYAMGFEQVSADH
jgi:hypothetical protein